MANLLSLKIHRLKKAHKKNKSEIEEIAKKLLQIKRDLTKYKDYLIMNQYLKTTIELLDKFKMMHQVEQANFDRKLMEEERNLESL
jgi:hypothetical protein